MLMRSVSEYTRHRRADRQLVLLMHDDWFSRQLSLNAALVANQPVQLNVIGAVRIHRNGVFKAQRPDGAALQTAGVQTFQVGSSSS